MGTKRQYWKEKEDDLMKLVLTLDNDSREWLTAYNGILPKLKVMGYKVLRQYYHVPCDAIGDNLVLEAIGKLVVEGKFNPDKPQLYSYCGTILKNYYYNALVQEYGDGNRAFNSRLHSTDAFDDDEDNNYRDNYIDSNEDSFNYEKRMEQHIIIKKIIQSETAKTLNELSDLEYTLTLNPRRYNPRSKINNLNLKIRTLELTNKYFDEFIYSSSLSNQSLAEYIVYNIGISDNRNNLNLVGKYLKETLNITVHVPSAIHGNNWKNMI